MFCITEEKKEEEEERKKKEKEEREKRRSKRPTLGIYQPPSLVRHRQQRDIGDDTETTQGTVRPNKKIPVFTVTRPYLNLPVKPRIFFRFSGSKYNFMKFRLSKCIPEKKFRLLPDTHLFFIWPYHKSR